jgi:hypothetical protein
MKIIIEITDCEIKKYLNIKRNKKAFDKWKINNCPLYRSILTILIIEKIQSIKKL